MNLKKIEDFYPLAPMQQGMLFHLLYAPKSGMYFQQLSCTLRGDLDPEAFERAWQRVVDRHSILRASFVWEDLNEPIQVVRRQARLPFERLDWRDLPPAQQQERLESFRQADQDRGFDLATAPLMRLTLIRLAEDTYQFIWSYLHLLLDGWSAPLLYKEIFAFYDAFRRGQDLRLEQSRPYRDYIAWLRRQDLQKAETFWRQTLKGFTAPTPLPGDRSPGSLPSQVAEYDFRSTQLSQAATAALQALASKHQLTLNTVVQGAWALVLSRYSRMDDVVFGATVSGRPADLPGAELMLGLFINTLPVRVRVSPEASLLRFLKELQEQQVEMRQYEYSPLVQVHGWSESPRGLPLFESILIFENYPRDSSLLSLSKSLEVSNPRNVEKTNYPFTVGVAPGSEMWLWITYDSHRFDAATISRMLAAFQTLLEGIAAADPEQRLGRLPLLAEAERRQLLVEWNQTQVAYPHDRCIHELFEARAELTPEAVAVICEDQRLSYRELNARANQLTAHLRRLGVGPEVRVGIYLERSPEMIVGLLGVLKAGGAYLPLDAAAPPSRLAFMLADAEAKVLLTQQPLAAHLPEHRAQVLCLDADWETIAGESAQNLAGGATPDNLAYVIYTSGSTGAPKGVMIQHRSLVNYTATAGAAFGLTRADRVLQFASLSFDTSAEEIFPCLTAGATLVLRNDEMLASSAAFLRQCEAWGISVLDLPTAYWHELTAGLEAEAVAVPRSLRLVIIGGEKALPARVANWQEQAPRGVRLVNTYGPTEATIVATMGELVNAGEAPIGRPVGNVQTYVLDEQLQPAPVGAPGELYIGGAGLARGYLNRPEATAERFIPDPFSGEPGARLYRTGDVARYLAEGELEFVGRVDDQVKVRGYRIELGEIEAALRAHPAVRESAVIVRETAPGDQRLVAYLVAAQEPPPSVSELRAFLEGRLPEYTIPSAFVTLEAMPLTPNGKIDRRALPAPDQARPELAEGFLAPRTPTEEVVATVWAGVLGLERVGARDHFFELGGHSLLATQIISRLRKAFQTELPLRLLFERPTVEELALAIEEILIEEIEKLDEGAAQGLTEDEANVHPFRRR